MGFNWSRAFPSSATGSAIGAEVGRRLSKKYGQNAIGYGAAAGGLLGFASGLQKKVNPYMGRDIYNNAYQTIHNDVMQQARAVGRDVTGQANEIFARRGITGAAPAGVTAGNYGRVLSEAHQSLVPIKAQYEGLAARDELGARRLNEYEDRRQWGDAITSISALGVSVANDMAKEHEEEVRKKELEANKLRTLPAEFGSWGLDQQKTYLEHKFGVTLPQDWNTRTPEYRNWYMKNILGIFSQDGLSADRMGRWDVPDTGSMTGYPTGTPPTHPSAGYTGMGVNKDRTDPTATQQHPAAGYTGMGVNKDRTDPTKITPPASPTGRFGGSVQNTYLTDPPTGTVAGAKPVVGSGQPGHAGQKNTTIYHPPYDIPMSVPNSRVMAFKIMGSEKLIAEAKEISAVLRGYTGDGQGKQRLQDELRLISSILSARHEGRETEPVGEPYTGPTPDINDPKYNLPLPATGPISPTSPRLPFVGTDSIDTRPLNERDPLGPGNTIERRPADWPRPRPAPWPNPRPVPPQLGWEGYTGMGVDKDRTPLRYPNLPEGYTGMGVNRDRSDIADVFQPKAQIDTTPLHERDPLGPRNIIPRRDPSAEAARAAQDATVHSTSPGRRQELDRPDPYRMTKEFEGFRTGVYLLQGIPHIGYGRNLRDNPLSPDERKHLGLKPGQKISKITKSQAEYLFKNDMRESRDHLRDTLGDDAFNRLNDARRLALTDMIYNMGTGSFDGFKNTIGYLRRGDFLNASKEMLDSKWYRDRATKRRAAILSEIVRTGKITAGRDYRTYNPEVTLNPADHIQPSELNPRSTSPGQREGGVGMSPPQQMIPAPDGSVVPNPFNKGMQPHPATKPNPGVNIPQPGQQSPQDVPSGLDQASAFEKTSPAIQSTLAKEDQDALKENAKKPTSQADLQRYMQLFPDGMRMILANPNSQLYASMMSADTAEVLAAMFTNIGPELTTQFVQAYISV